MLKNHWNKLAILMCVELHKDGDKSYLSMIVWDGQQCNGNEGPCCTNTKMPWFTKTLNENTAEDIELRMCANQIYPDEDTWIL